MKSYNSTSPGTNRILLERKPLKEEIFDFLHQRIIAGTFNPGEWLRQEDISKQLGVSQTPVREGLDLLVASGIAEKIPYRGVRVLQLTQAEIVEAYVMRLLLECTAAHTAAQFRKESSISKLSLLVEKSRTLVNLNNMSVQMQLNREFHHTLVASAENTLLLRLFEIVSHQFPDWMLYKYLFQHPENLQTSFANELREHQSILDALIVKDSHQAQKNVSIHIKNLGNELVNYLEIPQSLINEKENQILPLHLL